MFEDAALPPEKDPQAAQTPVAAGAPDIRSVVHLLAYPPGQSLQTAVQLQQR